jgi:hypothetical protein
MLVAILLFIVHPLFVLRTFSFFSRKTECTVEQWLGATIIIMTLLCQLNNRDWEERKECTVDCTVRMYFLKIYYINENYLNHARYSSYSSRSITPSALALAYRGSFPVDMYTIAVFIVIHLLARNYSRHKHASICDIGIESTPSLLCLCNKRLLKQTFFKTHFFG